MIDITAELVRDLVRAQHPDLAARPVRLGALRAPVARRNDQARPSGASR